MGVRRFGNINYIEGSCLSLYRGLIPEEFSIHSIYPNPFNPITQITYGIPNNINVKIAIYDVKGQLIQILIDKQHTPGFYTIDFEASNIPSGLYLARIVSGKYINTKKLMLIK